jgi:vancomycin resistance protein YoaR
MTSPRKIQPALLVTSLVIGCLCAILIGTFVWSAHIGRVYNGRILPHVSVSGIAIGGLNETEANKKLHTSLGQEKVRNVSVQIKEKTYTLTAETPDGSFVEPSSALAHKAFLIGRGTNPLRNVWDRVRLSLWSSTEVPLSVEVNPERLQKILEPKIGDLLQQPSDAALIVDRATGLVSISPEQTGRSINWKDAAERIRGHINRREKGAVTIPLQEATANLVSADLGALRENAESWLKLPPLTLVTTSTVNASFSLTSSTLVGWINVTSSAPHVATLELNRTTADQTLRNWLGTNVRVAQDGLLELDEQGKIKTFVAPKEGLGPDTEKTLENIQSAWANHATTTQLAVRVEHPTIRGDAERLGIRELIGVGTSNFSGSPTNRRKNIRLGMEHVHGTIIPAGEEFSMLKALGEIDGAHGWFPELVIKGNKTLPEFGGGLCQIGTTAFRGAMNSGFEITERRNHSYRVRYYEPAGTDATIYDPSPDFRFKNDTANAVLITGEIQGDVVQFSFWGTSDGRKGTIGPSRVTKVVSPPPTKLIETTDLAPGVKKCTETAHAGATAQVDYTVSYANGESKKVTFTSVYRPWQAVCLIGVTAISAPAAAEAATIDQTGINNLN